MLILIVRDQHKISSRYISPCQLQRTKSKPALESKVEVMKNDDKLQKGHLNQFVTKRVNDTIWPLNKKIQFLS